MKKNTKSKSQYELKINGGIKDEKPPSLNVPVSFIHKETFDSRAYRRMIRTGKGLPQPDVLKDGYALDSMVFVYGARMAQDEEVASIRQLAIRLTQDYDYPVSPDSIPKRAFFKGESGNIYCLGTSLKPKLVQGTQGLVPFGEFYTIDHVLFLCRARQEKKANSECLAQE